MAINTNSFHINNFQTLFPGFELDELMPHLSIDAVEGISVKSFIKTVSKIKGIDGLIDLFECCHDNFSTSTLVKKIADLTHTKLKWKLKETGRDRELDNVTYHYKVMKAAALNAIAQSTKKTSLEDLDEKGSDGSVEKTTSLSETQSPKQQRTDQILGQNTNLAQMAGPTVGTPPSLNPAMPNFGFPFGTVPISGLNAYPNFMRPLAMGTPPSLSSSNPNFGLLQRSIQILGQNPIAKPPTMNPSTTFNPISPSSSIPTSSDILRRMAQSQLSTAINEVPNLGSTTPQSTLTSARTVSNETQKRSSQYSAAEKENMVNFMLEQFPKIEPKVLYLALRHYQFKMDSFFEEFYAGKVNFDDLERTYLLEEFATVKKRLDELEEKNSPKKNENVSDVKTTENDDQPNEIKAESIEGFVPPVTWVEQDGSKYTNTHFRLEPVILHSNEGIEVVQRFYENDAKSRQVFEIKSIVRIENANSYNLYNAAGLKISKTNQHKKNEKKLFHGTTAEALKQIVNTGFDIRLSSFKGAAGAGIYFAEFPRTSLSYIRDCPNTEKKVLLCRVELGSATSIPNLHKAHPFSSPTNPIRRPQARSPEDPTPFDSVYGNMRGDPNDPIHVIYDHYQAYPEYIITFAINENRIIRGKPPQVPVIIGPDHPRYRAQLEETKKSLKFLKRTLEFAPNKTTKAYKDLETLHSLLTSDPDDKNSIHCQPLPMNLDLLQSYVRHYNDLCANNPIILIGENTPTREEFEASKNKTTSSASQILNPASSNAQPNNQLTTTTPNNTQATPTSTNSAQIKNEPSNKS